MRRTTTAPTGRSTRRRLRAAALAVLTALLAVLATPTAASATGSYYGGSYGDYGGSYDGGGYSGDKYVFPVLNCVLAGTNGSYTAVLGYKNTHRSNTYNITGGYNQISPSQYNGRQPTTFKPGTYNGVFRVQVTSGTVYWDLANTRLTISRTAAAACPADTQMPADGNGTGVVVALAIAAGLGALFVRRARRRAAAPTPIQEPVHA